MDNRLFGKTILIGREPVNGRLLVSMKHNGKNYFAPIGQPGSVSGGLSRCIPGEDKAHCRLQIDMKGNMTLENAKAENVTFVDGTQIMKKHIDEGSIIEMGQYKYQVSVAEVLKTLTLIANQVIGGGSAVKSGGGASENVPTFSIDHLKAVYDEFHDKQMEIKYRQRNLNQRRGADIHHQQRRRVAHIGRQPHGDRRYNRAFLRGSCRYNLCFLYGLQRQEHRRTRQADRRVPTQVCVSEPAVPPLPRRETVQPAQTGQRLRLLQVSFREVERAMKV